MAIGDQKDFLTRIKALLPNAWFGDTTPVLDSVLSGIAFVLTSVYSLTQYARFQTRIASATDAFLDLISFDFFGLTLPRKTGESDTAFRTRIQAELFLEKGTREGMIRALELLTGRAPIIFEPSRIADTKCYNSSAYYNYAAQYGSRLPYQGFIIAYRPFAQLSDSISGYNNALVAYNTKGATYTNLSILAGAVTDQDILNTINSTKPEATIVWVIISN
jgi:hypothetical protein